MKANVRNTHSRCTSIGLDVWKDIHIQRLQGLTFFYWMMPIELVLCVIAFLLESSNSQIDSDSFVCGFSEWHLMSKFVLKVPTHDEEVTSSQ